MKRVGVVVLALLAGTASSAQVISPRLRLDVERKSPEPISVQLWLKEGAAPPADAIEVGPQLFLGAYPVSDIEALAASGAAEYIAPSDAIEAPQPEADEALATAASGEPSDGFAKALPRWPTSTGRGTTIGIIDFGRPPALPAIVATRSFGIGGRSDHFAQVAQIIHRLAPDAQILAASLSPTQATSTDVARAAEWLAAQGAQIITFSGVSYLGRRDGQAPLDRVVDRLARRNILWVAAAGNEAQRSWSGWTDQQTRDGLLEVAPGLASIAITSPGGTINVAVTWDEWGWSGAPRGGWDVDAVLKDSSGREVIAARTRRAAIGEPVETLSARNLPAGVYRLELPVRGSGAPVRVRVVTTGSVTAINPSVPSETVGSPATAVGALAVGAVASPRFTTSPYTGQGPTADRRPKPDIAALASAGNGTVGTSYAAPRIAALAACLIAEQPNLTVAALRARLAAYAQPVAGRRTLLGEARLWVDTRARER
ncbi:MULTISPECIES: S8 family serine peptidase [Sphingomonas]|uniref:S8 family serine peptidase n=1 Tax=Sphingomonas TaxID=13687 RepID=UPI00082C1081|nr:S8 family serine peptidase [Sphingomonas sp. CCH10-B3]